MVGKSNNILIASVSLLLLIIFGYILIRDIGSKNNRSLVALPTLTPSGFIVTPLPSPVQSKFFDDQMVNCNIDANCGGGTKYISKEACLNSTCCLLGESFVPYESKNKCLYDQILLSGSDSASFTPINEAVYVRTYSAYIYCKPHVIPQIREVDKITIEWIEKVKSCSSGTQYDYSNCLKSCSDINSWENCSKECRNQSNISSCDSFKEYPLNDLNAIILGNCG